MKLSERIEQLADLQLEINKIRELEAIINTSSLIISEGAYNDDKRLRFIESDRLLNPLRIAIQGSIDSTVATLTEEIYALLSYKKSA